MTTKEELINRLINWLDEECPNVAPPLEPYSTLDLSHDFAGILRSKLDKILATQPQEPQEAEEVAQWVINNRYPKSELEKVSDKEMYEYIVKELGQYHASKVISDEEIYEHIREVRMKLLLGEHGTMGIGRMTLGEIEWMNLCIDLVKWARYYKSK